MTIYLDSDFICHLTDGGGMRPIETTAFDGKCAAFIEGYRFVPAGESWTRADGAVIHGPSLFPADNIDLLQRFQAQHEADEAAHLAELGALIEEIYNEDMEAIDNV